MFTLAHAQQSGASSATCEFVDNTIEALQRSIAEDVSMAGLGRLCIFQLLIYRNFPRYPLQTPLPLPDKTDKTDKTPVLDV